MDIVKGEIDHCQLLAKIGKESFLESHGHSAPKKEINSFINATFSEKAICKELSNPENLYHLVYHKNEIAGYSKIVLNSINPHIKDNHITKLDRFYLLKAFYGQDLGTELLNYNIQFSKIKNQKGIWLAVWIDNFRAINFYKKHGFFIVGSYNFIISETHTNPNHIMYLKY